ncbi:MAG: bifunctional [glutamate--ammonia ligase]-adenylyl-L-tyrosine phosphorylase/[glutamate--ammonia-ligase] adenylyltransferase [Verrucomicrobiota bacterium]
MRSTVWKEALAACADPPRAKRYYESLLRTGAGAELKKASAEQARIVTALFSGSQALSDLLMAHPGWFHAALDVELLRNPRQEQGLRREVNAFLKPALQRGEYTEACRQLREFKQREMLRIAARDLARLGDVTEITREISNVADVCLEGVYQLVAHQMTARLGAPFHQDVEGNWQATGFCVLGMGKLGGQELNYSSDVDVIFVYSEEGHVFKEPPRKKDVAGKGMSNHQFFTRLAKEFIVEVSRMADEGSLFRIDLRLRPEGDSGPLVRSLASYENYYAQWGQSWERMMLIKARCVAGDQPLGAEFLETIQHFRYPRLLGERILREVAATKGRIENEVVKAGEIDRNVKLGRGGIREVEFIAQTLQVLHAGRIPFLQGAQTLPTLANLVRYHLLSREDAEQLRAAYCFLRDVEHRLQMENNLQTHTIPTERKARERLAALMGFEALKDFEAALRQHTQRVRAVYDQMLNAAPETAAEEPLPRDFAAHEVEWKTMLANHSFRDADKAFRLIQIFVKGPGYVHVSPRTVELAMELVPRLLKLCPRRDVATKTEGPWRVLSDPDRVLARLDSFVSAYGARAMLYELWTTNPSLFELLIWLFDRSEFLAETAIRVPDLVDELELSGRLRRSKTAEEIFKDLAYGRADEDQRLWLRRYHQAEFMRIGLRDILGLADFEQNLVELSALADACLAYALDVVIRKHRLKQAPFAIIGLGKLGGSEINYGSDLDITFVADSKTKDLPKLQKLAVEVMDLLSAPTELGVAFATDARLRPDGEKGLIANTLAAYEDYYRQRAQLWEIQAISRARFVAGDVKTGEAFQKLVGKLCNFTKPSAIAAYTPDWKKEIARMRLRIEKERTPAGQNHLAIKTGTGGLIDAEFIAQYLCLAHGWQEPNTLKALQRGRTEKALATADAELLIENYRKLRRVEGILRRWSYAGETVLPDDAAALYRVAVRCGHRTAEEFMQVVGEYRANIRKVYEKVVT